MTERADTHASRTKADCGYAAARWQHGGTRNGESWAQPASIGQSRSGHRLGRTLLNCGSAW